jgi:hypothetical protein
MVVLKKEQARVDLLQLQEVLARHMVQNDDFRILGHRRQVCSAKTAVDDQVALDTSGSGVAKTGLHQQTAPPEAEDSAQGAVFPWLQHTQPPFLRVSAANRPAALCLRVRFRASSRKQI